MNYYVLMGNPVPLARCRVGNRRVWDSQKQIKLMHGLELIKQHNNAPLYLGPLLLEAEFVFPVPKKTSIKNREAMYDTPYPYTPDLDNLFKYIGDICNGILYDDDSSIAIISAKKVYGEVPKTVFGLKELHEKKSSK